MPSCASPAKLVREIEQSTRVVDGQSGIRAPCSLPRGARSGEEIVIKTHRDGSNGAALHVSGTAPSC